MVHSTYWLSSSVVHTEIFNLSRYIYGISQPFSNKYGDDILFYEIFVNLCAQKGVSASFVVQQIGLNKSSATYWKNGSVPKGDTLQKLADYFGVSSDYLLGRAPANQTGKTETYQPWTQTDEKIFQLGGFQALAEFEFLSEADKAEALKDINKFVEFTLSKYQRTPPQDSGESTPPAPEDTDTAPEEKPPTGP